MMKITYKSLFTGFVSIALVAVMQSGFAKSYVKVKPSKAKLKTSTKPLALKYKKRVTTKSLIQNRKKARKSYVAINASFPKFYVGASVGASRLTPKVTSIGGNVTENMDFANKVYIGYNVTPHIALELSHAYMGGARINTGTQKADVRYKLSGISAVYTKKLGNWVNGFARLGYADMENKVVPAIPFEKEKRKTAFGGVGLEYVMSNKLSYKGELEYYGRDAQMLSFGFQWRF